MANSDKDILITPNTGSSSADPKIEYVGADSSANDTITVETQFDGSKSTLSFEGSAGQLFSVSNDLSGTLFAVNDGSGIPSIEVDSDGEIRLAEFSGNVGIGISTPTELLHVDGRIKANNLTLASLSAQNSEATAVMIDGSGIIGTRELGSNAFNSTSYLTGNQTITLSGDVQGTGTTSISVSINDDSHNHIISNVDGLQTALDAKAPVSTTVTTNGAQTISGVKTHSTTLALSSGQKLTLKDGNHFIQYLSTGFSGSTIDGPIVAGHQGGELVTNLSSNNYSLRWDSAGNIIVRNDGFFNGTKLEGDSKEMIRYSDSWLRLNPANEFTSGIYLGTGIIRTDGQFQVGASGSQFKIENNGNTTVSGSLNCESFAINGASLTSTIAELNYSDGVTSNIQTQLNARVLKGSTSANTPSNITTFTSNDTIPTTSGSQSGLQVFQDTTGADAFMTFHISNDYAGYFGLDGGINDFAVGGWSFGANSYRVFHAGNSVQFTSALNTKLSGIATGADVTPSWVPSSNPNYLTSFDITTQTDSKYVRSDTADTASGQITFSNGGIFATNGVRVYRQNTNSTIWFNGSSAADTNHALWNAYYGNSPTTRGAANTGFDGIYWNTYRGLHIRGGLAGAVDCIKVTNSSGSNTDHAVTLYASNVARLATNTTGVDVTGRTTTDGLTSAGSIIVSGASPTIISRGADSEMIFQSTNESAGNPQQFYIQHNLGNVNIGNSRGNINFNAGTLQYGGNTVLTTASTQSKYLRSDTSDSHTSGQITFNGGIHIGSTNTYIVQHVTNGLGFRVGTGNYYGLKIDPTAGHTETIKTGVGGAFNAAQGVLQVKGDQTMNRGSFIRWANDGGGTGEYIYSKSSSPYDVTIHSGSYDALQCPNTGTVRINYNGAQKFVTSSSGVSITGTLTASADVVAYSDRNKKKNIRDLEPASKYLNSINPKRFAWKDTEKEDIGFIAQDVEKAGLNELVCDSPVYNPETALEEGTVKTLNYGKMVSVLWRAVQEQQETIEKLTSRINDLEKGE